MFRCESCGSGYSMRAASAWEACPRCIARDKITVPLTFELGWRGRDRSTEHAEPAKQPLPLRRIPLDGSTKEPVEVDAA